MSKDKRKDYCVNFKHAIIDVEVLDCIDEHEAIAYAENKIKELDFDFELEAYQCGGHGKENEMITLKRIKNIAEDIKEDNKEWVNDSHSHSKYVGICDGLDELMNCLEVEFLGKAYKGNRGDKYE